ncbi:XRN 5'-3' exonuclease N-terminus domain-containing protein [Tetraselmis virus 1]|uniref:XRN 5'-3' exonuclease N-terminus domain-containing protein n=1 Tax=Tetraselmis virus 1 TaxID=2060617 RepID=A0A2P0VML8_9VIRU|nr:XRN 5'-3' exonuclease N-terminus domain-containing protein [Tetraselmis virus 1]AUF82138.1 XRN 5'-3' exonuclease N-terminus domain-containing protein [Tetraselmis virus 1]
MGVPGYFSYARKICPHAVKSADDNDIPKFKVLYVDFNSLIHNSVPRTDEDVSYQTVVENSVKLLIDVAAEVDAPLVHVRTDGVPPLAKICQQRTRRFLAAKRNQFLSNNSKRFDRNCITPGTEFMRYLDGMVPVLLSRSEDGRKYTYSGSDEDGEGEQKIMKEIRSSSQSGDVCIYGLDADLILLCTCLKAQGFSPPWLCREHHETGRMNFVNSDMMSRHVSGGKLWNHVICSFLCGNDFLPALSCLDVGKDLATMRNICHRNGLSLVSEDGASINWPHLATLLEIVSDNEDYDFKKADDEYWACNPKGELSREDEWDMYPVLNKNEAHRVIRPGLPDWRTRYYISIFGIRNASGINRITGEFIRGIQWTFNYYKGDYEPGITPPAWYYPYSYGPTSFDLSNYVKDCDGVPPPAVLTALDTTPISENELIMYVTPRASEGILHMDTNTKRTPEWLFPVDGRITTYLHKKIWHCKADIPHSHPSEVSVISMGVS